MAALGRKFSQTIKCPLPPKLELLSLTSYDTIFQRNQKFGGKRCFLKQRDAIPKANRMRMVLRCYRNRMQSPPFCQQTFNRFLTKKAGEDCAFLEDLKPPEKKGPVCRLARKRMHLEALRKKAEAEKKKAEESAVMTLDDKVAELKFQCMLTAEIKRCEECQYVRLCQDLKNIEKEFAHDPPAVDKVVRCLLCRIRESCRQHAERKVCEWKNARSEAAQEAKEPTDSGRKTCKQSSEPEPATNECQLLEQRKKREQDTLARLMKYNKQKCVDEYWQEVCRRRQQKEQQAKEQKKRLDDEAALRKKCQETAKKLKQQQAEREKKCKAELAKKKKEENKCEKARATNECNKDSKKEKEKKKSKCSAFKTKPKGKCDNDKEKE
ncbi:hypothetical protein KR018_007111 [Drosophila ironensis]|nr:hypothetical protein KR018_007111 [Drosophila ironensis]